MIKLVDRYVGRSTLFAILAVWLALTTLMSMFTFLDQLGDSGSGVKVLAILYFVLLKSANAAYVVFPISALLGAMIGVGGLAAGNELVAFRTAGVSRLRISGSVLGAVLALSAAVMAMAEWVMPVAEAQARALKDNRFESGNRAGRERGMWVRDGNSVINISRAVVTQLGQNSDVTLRNVEQYRFDDEGKLDEVIRAASVDLDKELWTLRASSTIAITPNAVTRTFEESAPWNVGFKAGLLESAVTRPRYMSMRGILDQVRYLRLNGLDARAYNTVLWRKILFPLSVLSLVLAGMPFVFGSARTHSLGLRIFIGMSLGGAFMIVSRTMQNFSDAYALPSLVGTALPALALTLLVVLVLRRSV